MGQNPWNTFAAACQVDKTSRVPGNPLVLIFCVRDEGRGFGADTGNLYIPHKDCSFLTINLAFCFKEVHF